VDRTLAPTCSRNKQGFPNWTRRDWKQAGSQSRAISPKGMLPPRMSTTMKKRRRSMRYRSLHSLRGKTDILYFNFLTTLTFNFYFAPKFRI